MEQQVLMGLNVLKIQLILSMLTFCIQHSLVLVARVSHLKLLLPQLLMRQRKVAKISYFVVVLFVFNPLKCRGVRWLHFEVFNAIQV